MNARGIINRYGKALTFYKEVDEGVYDPSTGTVLRDAAVSYSVKGYFFDYETEEVDGTSVVHGDRRLMISRYTTTGTTIPTPEVDDSFTGEGDKVKVVSVAKIMFGENPEAYILQVRE